MLAVVIPTLNAAAGLPAALDSLAPGRDRIAEIAVADGGSADGTVEIAEAAGVRAIEAPRGRGRQLRVGVAATTSPWLLILHADSRLGPDWPGALPMDGRAGWFRLRLDDPAPAARRIERLSCWGAPGLWPPFPAPGGGRAGGAARPGRARRIERLANWRARRFGLPYGDQGLVLPRALYDAVGGYRDMPLMEDVDLVRRIGRRRLDELDAEVVTSAIRYRRDGYWRRPLRNLACLSLFLAGMAPERIQRLYE